MVFCYQNCSDLLWEKIVLVIANFFLKLEVEGREFAKFLRSLKYGFHKKYFWKNEPLTSCLPIFSRSVLIWKKSGDKSVRLVRGSFFRKYFLWNPYFKGSFFFLYLILEIKPCRLGSRIWYVEAFWYKTEIFI